MKIAYISSSPIPSRAANSIHVMKMCQAFAKNGHVVDLIAPNRVLECEDNISDTYQFYGVKPIFKITKLAWLRIGGLRSVYYAINVLFNLLKTKPDLVYGRDLYGCLLASFFFKVSYESHSPAGNKMKVQLLNLMFSRGNFQKLIVISSALKEHMLKEQNISEHKILVAHDAADEMLTNNKVVLKGSAKAIKVGYVGHLYKGKGIEIIEKIAIQLNKKAEFHIVGGFTKDVDYWRERLKANNVFFYGFVPQSELQPYINALDICLLPNQKVVMPYGAKRLSANISDFTSPLKMFEYMAAKKAIVASDLPVLKEVLNDHNSITCDPESPEDWIRAIESLEDTHFRSVLSENAYKDFSRSHTWQKRAQAVL